MHLKLVSLCCLVLCLSGCLNQVLNIARSPTAVATALTEQTATTFVGDDLGTLFSDTETAQSIDRALTDNPNAANSEELRGLRDDLEANRMGSDGRYGYSSSARRDSYYDRRSKEEYSSPYRIDTRTGMVYNTDEIGYINAPRVPLEKELPKDRLLRSRDEWRFSIPDQINIKEHSTDMYKFDNKFKPIIIKPNQLPPLR